MIKWSKSNISILIFCESLGEFIKESVSCESAPQLLETGQLIRVQYKLPNITDGDICVRLWFCEHYQGHLQGLIDCTRSQSIPEGTS